MRRSAPPLLLGLVNGALALAIGFALSGGAAVAAHPLAAAAAVLLALAVGIFTGYRWMAPARRLAGAAERLGAGDLRTPVPAEGDAEMARLGGTLEEMRRRLLVLTTELERSEGEARAVLAGVVEGVLAVDGERRITYLNPQAERLLGTTTDEARGRFCGDVLRAEGPDGTWPCDDRCPLVHARSRGMSRAVESLALPAGKRHVVLTTSAPSGGAGGSQVMVLRDETEEETGRRVRDVVLANLSHELKTPLAAQLASVELLRDGLAASPPDSPAAQAAVLVGSLERSTLRLLGLVENLLASARLETGDWAMRSEPVDLAEVAREAAVLLAPLFEQRRQRVEPVAAAGAWVMGDRTQLLQVMLNLLGNANKFAPEGTRVRIGGGRDGDDAVLRVEDEGPGLPAVDEASLFGRYRRFGSKPAGAGLGLWIVHSIVRRHGGSVTAETRREGGARFTVRLPATSMPVTATAPRVVGEVVESSPVASSAGVASKVGAA